MDAAEFFGLEPTDDRRHWLLPVTPGNLSGLGALFGGCALAAGIEALERCTGRPVVYAAVQFLSFAKPPSVVAIEVIEAVRGHRVSQARAVGRVDGEEIFTVNAALGKRESPVDGVWVQPPDVAPPGDSPPRETLEHPRGTVMERVDMRMANAREPHQLDGTPSADGRSALWVRIPDLELSAAALGFVGDYVPFGILQSIGRMIGGNSIDNTLRVVRTVPTEWILADIRTLAVRDGFGHGSVFLWSERGDLLGIASQTTIVRENPRPV